jgi:hypothetical protein
LVPTGLQRKEILFTPACNGQINSSIETSS